MKRMACAIALAAGSSITGFAALPALANPSPATAEVGLQVTVTPPGTVSGDATIPLDVKFHGGNIRVIELFVDGARLTRQALTTRDGRGVVHFSLDPSLLAEGSHEVLIKAYEADGTCATTTTQINVAPADANALAKFEWPKRNAEVQGIVPIKIKIDPSITDPYVTYTVDNDFLAFRNYAPYVYNWDTAKVGNGIHNIGIEVMDGRTLQVVQKMTIVINVKNVGGLTMIPPTAGAKTERPAAGSVAEAIQGVAESVLPNADLSVRDSVLGLARSSSHGPQSRMGANSTLTGFRSNTPLRRVDPGRNLPALPTMEANASDSVLKYLPLQNSVDTLRTSMAGIAAPNVNRPAPNPGGMHIAPGLAALAANPRDLMPSLAGATFGLARQSVHFRRVGAIALRPSTEHRVVRGSAAPASLPAFTHSKRKTFDVAFNNTIINFDVAPRVENGLPLAPFRAIFEHAGGTVKWNNEVKLLRAFDSQHDIEIKIGSKEAKVNNVPMSMEAVPYLDHGRTIVPLSFVRDAMDLKVTFDQETGHLMIEKK